MKLLRPLAAWIGGVSLALSSAVAQAPPAPPVSETPPPGAVPGPALWKVSDADTTIYLFGTVHALPKDKAWYDARIARAYGSAGELVTEIDTSALGTSSQTLSKEGTLPAGPSLREMMKADDRQQYEAAMVALGLPVEALDRYQPWFAAMTLSLLPLLKTGYDTQNGVELTLAGQGGSRKHSGLETVAQQIALFETMPMDEQLVFLDKTVEDLPKASASLDAMVAAWLKGDADTLGTLLNAELTDAQLRDRLLTHRNAQWAQWIKQRLDQPGTVFVAVGAGHLAGEGSVQDQLRKLGVTVQRVWQ